ncbi:MAG TPA: response regulator [Candidatus Thermoplasmatota archaeon]|nr:response regulator [Candidatus Thermoplasmatota archaeon]
MRILVVDDSEAIAKQLATILGTLRAEVQISWAGDLAQARTLLATQPPDVVFLDLLLGDDDGVDLMWDIGRASMRTRIVTMSALAAHHARVTQASALGARAHLEKPLRAPDVERALAAAQGA